MTITACRVAASLCVASQGMVLPDRARAHPRNLMTPKLLHERLWQLESEQHPRHALSLMFETIDNWMLDGKFEPVRETLRTVCLEKHSITGALGFATITLPARDELGEDRAEYIARLMMWLREKDPTRADSLIRGLK